MSKKTKKTSRKQAKKASVKTKRPSKNHKNVPRSASLGKPKVASLPVRAPVEPPAGRGEANVHGGRIEIAIERIGGETIIGDMLVVFPRTREVLKRHGLNLDVEEAGDIYMSLDAFAALQGLKPDTLVRELEIVSKEPPVPQVPATVAAPVP